MIFDSFAKPFIKEQFQTAGEFVVQHWAIVICPTSEKLHDMPEEVSPPEALETNFLKKYTLSKALNHLHT